MELKNICSRYGQSAIIAMVSIMASTQSFSSGVGIGFCLQVVDLDDIIPSPPQKWWHCLVIFQLQSHFIKCEITNLTLLVYKKLHDHPQGGFWLFLTQQAL